MTESFEECYRQLPEMFLNTVSACPNNEHNQILESVAAHSPFIRFIKFALENEKPKE
jgi:hypothetical protein